MLSCACCHAAGQRVPLRCQVRSSHPYVPSCSYTRSEVALICISPSSRHDFGFTPIPVSQISTTGQHILLWRSQQSKQAALLQAASLPMLELSAATSTASLRAAASLRAGAFYLYPEGRSELAQKVERASCKPTDCTNLDSSSVFGVLHRHTRG